MIQLCVVSVESLTGSTLVTVLTFKEKVNDKYLHEYTLLNLITLLLMQPVICRVKSKYKYLQIVLKYCTWVNALWPLHSLTFFYIDAKTIIVDAWSCFSVFSVFIVSFSASAGSCFNPLMFSSAKKKGIMNIILEFNAKWVDFFNKIWKKIARFVLKYLIEQVKKVFFRQRAGCRQSNRFQISGFILLTDFYPTKLQPFHNFNHIPYLLHHDSNLCLARKHS